MSVTTTNLKEAIFRSADQYYNTVDMGGFHV